jgi:ATP-dependent 26S proteasome regulatory subunit
VSVVIATSKQRKVAPALLRPGRFDVYVSVQSAVPACLPAWLV